MRTLIFTLLSIVAPLMNICGVTTQSLGVTNITILPAAAGDTSYSFLSSAYNQEPVYSGYIEGVNGATLTLDALIDELSEDGIEDGDLSQAPHLLRLRGANAVEDEIHEGMVFVVLDNIGNDVVINNENISAYLSEGDTIDIIEATTLGELFGTGENFHGLRGTPAKADNVLIWTTYGWSTYFYYNDKWQTYGSRQDQGSTIIYPDEGLIYARRSEDALTLSFSGYVPYEVQSYRPGPDGKFLMSNPFPIPMALSQLIDISSNWATSTNINDADQILCWGGSAWTVYYNNGSDWINSTTMEIDDHALESGESFFVVRSDISALTPGYNKIDLPE